MGELIRWRVFDGVKMHYPTKGDDHAWSLARDGTVWKYKRCYDCTLRTKHLDAVAMLSIGMTDKNGKEVWVGDIVSFPTLARGEVLQGEVVRRGVKFLLWTPEEVAYDICYAKLGEVIGNVHEKGL